MTHPSCKFCDNKAFYSMEGFDPEVPEFFVCPLHTKQGDEFLAHCTFKSIACLEVIRQEDLEEKLNENHTRTDIDP
jgi:hypothetical protein